MTKILLLSDTHSYIDDQILKYAEAVDEVWHAGDIGDLRVTDALSKVATLRAVYGNIDDHKARATYPRDLHFTCEGKKVFMTHIGGRVTKLPLRIKEILQKQQPDIYICGHSHILLVQYHKEHKLLALNPGAIGKHGFHKVRTLLRFEIDGGKVGNMEAIECMPR
ncbi:MAG: metallophosphatase family protein [Schleiferiaceae bacterium]|nr:metallophosphatase family protein [Schleiferiaceae bacterium]